MIKQLVKFRFSFLTMILLFFTGCYTQMGNVKKTSTKDYEPPAEDVYYEDEYQDEGDTVYVAEDETAPTYQYNFYGYDPFDVDFYFSPYYHGIAFNYGYNPWFYDPWFYDPWYVSYRDPWYRPYGRWNPYRYGGFYGSYWGGGYYGYYGYSSAYYGTYDPYWGYVNYGRYVTVVPQNRRNFDHRRGLASGRTDTDVPHPYMNTVASGGKRTSQVERIRKTTTTTSGREQITNVTNNRTRKSGDSKIRVISTKPVRKTTTQGRLTRTPTTIRSKITTRQPTNQSNINNNRRTIKSVPNVIPRKTTTRTRAATPSSVRKSGRTKKYTPSYTRTNRSSSSSNRSSNTTIKPRTSSGATRSVSSPPTRSGSSTSRSTSSTSKSGSSSRTKKK